MIEGWFCSECEKPLTNSGAESRGDGDIYDVWVCDEHGPILHVHADYCECGCGGEQIDNVYDPDDIPSYVFEDFTTGDISKAGG